MENFQLESMSTESLLSLKNSIEAIIAGRQNPGCKMSDKIKIVQFDYAIKVHCYYNEQFIAKARNLKGKWDNGCWYFSESMLVHVKQALIDCFGVDGMSPYLVCTLVVSNFDAMEYHAGVELFGRLVCSGAKPSDDIFLLSGEFTSGSSGKNWHTYVNDATFEIHNFPVNYQSAKWAEDLDIAISEGWVKIKMA